MASFQKKIMVLFVGVILFSFASLFGINSSISPPNVLTPLERADEAVIRTSPDEDLGRVNQSQFVAIVSCIRSVESWKSVNETSLYNAFLPSIWPSVTNDERKKYRVEVLLAFDEGDTFWQSPAHHTAISTGLPFAVNFISVLKDRPHRIPFNEACRSAYENGADFIARVNDDSQFTSSGWITKAIAALASFNPPNVGVVGPTCLEGKPVFSHMTWCIGLT